MAYQPGEVIGNRYRILAQIGRGAHGVIYRARDLETRDEVALKALGDANLDPDAVRRLEREAVSMAKLRGTSAVYVHGLNVHTDGKPYLVMEILYGTDLECFLNEAERRGGRLKAAKLLELMRPVIDTLEAAHNRGIVHRDLKPSNIFIVDVEHGGGVRLLDFGLAKMLDASGLTAEGMVAGTPSYIAPEVWDGEPSQLDHRIDVYSLGVIVFRALAGHVPHSANNMIDLYHWVHTGKRPSLHRERSKLPEALDAWVEKSLAANRDERFQDVRSQWNALEAILAKAPASPF
jgi:eukaryotic-like serine/threonine-protein kinase